MSLSPTARKWVRSVVDFGGELVIEWREADGHVIMTGPAQVDFTGMLP